MPKQMMIFAGLYQNNGTGRDTFISLYRKGTGKTGEPGAYQAATRSCCGCRPRPHQLWAAAAH